MKAWAVIGALMSLLASAPPEAAAERETREDGDGRSKPAGYAITGPGFYVWDEDRREAEEWALQLAESWARTIVATAPSHERDE